MSLFAPPDALPGVRDADLVARVEEARGRGGFEFVLKQCQYEQEKRDRTLLLPRDARRRQEIREKFEGTAPDRQNLRHIHSVLAICGLPYTRQPLDVREYERTQGRMSLVVEAGKPGFFEIKKPLFEVVDEARGLGALAGAGWSDEDHAHDSGGLWHGMLPP